MYQDFVQAGAIIRIWKTVGSVVGRLSAPVQLSSSSGHVNGCRGQISVCAGKKKEGIAVKISLNQMKRLQQDFSFQLQGREDVEA